MQAIESIVQGFLEHAQTETNIVGTLPTEKEDAVALIEHVKDKCKSIAIFDSDEWIEYTWEVHEGEGWQNEYDWSCHPTDEIAEDYSGCRIKFLGVKPVEQWK